jgi:hypothetical protein
MVLMMNREKKGLVTIGKTWFLGIQLASQWLHACLGVIEDMSTGTL